MRYTRAVLSVVCLGITFVPVQSSGSHQKKICHSVPVKLGSPLFDGKDGTDISVAVTIANAFTRTKKHHRSRRDIDGDQECPTVLYQYLGPCVAAAGAQTYYVVHLNLDPQGSSQTVPLGKCAQPTPAGPEQGQCVPQHRPHTMLMANRHVHATADLLADPSTLVLLLAEFTDETYCKHV